MAKKTPPDVALPVAPNEVQLSTRIDAKLARDFHIRCVEQGVSIKATLSKLVRGFVTQKS